MRFFRSAFVVIEGDFTTFVVATTKPVLTLRFIGAHEFSRAQGAAVIGVDLSAGPTVDFVKGRPTCREIAASPKRSHASVDSAHRFFARGTGMDPLIGLFVPL